MGLKGEKQHGVHNEISLVLIILHGVIEIKLCGQMVRLWRALHTKELRLYSLGNGGYQTVLSIGMPWSCFSYYK